MTETAKTPRLDVVLSHLKGATGAQHPHSGAVLVRCRALTVEGRRWVVETLIGETTWDQDVVIVEQAHIDAIVQSMTANGLVWNWLSDPE
jgi:hypothetical protein